MLCGNRCCPARTYCVDTFDGVCCPDSTVFTYDGCCDPKTSAVCGNRCCGPLDACCNVKQWCPLGRFCSSVDGCCKPNEVVCGDGKCCPLVHPGAGITWTNYPALHSTPDPSRWLVVECQLADVPSIPAGLDTSIRQFLGPSGAGYGNVVDYYHDVSYNKIAFDADFIGWVRAPFKLTDIGDVTTPVGGGFKRAERVRQCLEAIPSTLAPDFGAYFGVIAICNAAPGDASTGSIGRQSMTINNKQYQLASVWLDSNSLGTGFALHEISHAFGLRHSYDNSQGYCGGSSGEYCDPWDIMSAMSTYTFVDRNWLVLGNSTSGGPGMSAPNLLRMGWIPTTRQLSYQFDAGEQTVTIRALSHPQGNEPLVVLLHLGGLGPFDGLYTVEYRQADGWDQGFVGNPSAPALSPAGAVLVHQFRAAGDPAATLIETADAGAILPGKTVVLSSPLGAILHVTVKSIDTINATATVSIGPGRG